VTGKGKILIKLVGKNKAIGISHLSQRRTFLKGEKKRRYKKSGQSVLLKRNPGRRRSDVTATAQTEGGKWCGPCAKKIMGEGGEVEKGKGQQRRKSVNFLEIARGKRDKGKKDLR